MCTKPPRPPFKTPTADLSRRPPEARAAVPTGEGPQTGVTVVASTGGGGGGAHGAEEVPFAADRGGSGTEVCLHQQGDAVLGNDGSATTVERASGGAGRVAERPQKRAVIADG